MSASLLASSILFLRRSISSLVALRLARSCSISPAIFSVLLACAARSSSERCCILTLHLAASALASFTAPLASLNRAINPSRSTSVATNLLLTASIESSLSCNLFTNSIFFGFNLFTSAARAFFTLASLASASPLSLSSESLSAARCASPLSASRRCTPPSSRSSTRRSSSLLTSLDEILFSNIQCMSSPVAPLSSSCAPSSSSSSTSSSSLMAGSASR